ncbi:MAG: hypothetical protein V4726_08375 [Verrucomicrobiota bacterium]
MQSAETESSSMVTVARFRNREQAREFCAIAAECGVATRVSDSRRFNGSGSFDATLGGADSLEGCSIQVKAEDVAVLRTHLEANMEIDPLDPMHTADRAELLAMADGPLNGNLCEQIIAARILAKLPPATIGEILPGAADAYLAADRRMARWLGVTGLLFTAVYLVIFLDGLGFTPYPDSSYGHDQRHPGFSHYVPFEGEAIANNVRPFLIMLIPLGTGAALILSTRQLRDGTSRRMFPPFWRITGHLLFWLPLFIVGAVAGLVLFYRR